MNRRIPSILRRAGVRASRLGLVRAIEDILGDNHVASFLPADIASSGDGTAITSWPDSNAAVSFIPDAVAGSAAPTHRTAHWGARSLGSVDTDSDDILTISGGGIGDVFAGASMQPFTAVLALHAPETGGSDRRAFGWSPAPSFGSGGFVAARYESDGQWYFDMRGVGGGTTTLTLAGVTGEGEHFLIFSFDGTNLLVEHGKYAPSAQGAIQWSTAYNDAPTLTGTFTNFSQFSLGSCYTGVSNGLYSGRGVFNEAHFGSAASSSAQIASMKASIESRHSDPRAGRYILESRTTVIDENTATWGSGSGTPAPTNQETIYGYNGNVMYPHVVRLEHVGATHTYGMLFGHHSGSYIRRALSNSLDSGWVVQPDGAEGATITDLIAVNAGYSSGHADPHLGSPVVWWDSDDSKYYATVHGRLVGLTHQTVLMESTDFETWTFVDSGNVLIDGTYLHPFKVGGRWFAFGHDLDLWESMDPQGISSWSVSLNAAAIKAAVTGNIRHPRTTVVGGRAYVIWSTGNPSFDEHLVYSTMDVTDLDTSTWALSEQQTLIHAYTAGDGADHPFEYAEGGELYGERRALRDGYLMEDSGSYHLFYAQGSEHSIGHVDASSWVTAREAELGALAAPADDPYAPPAAFHPSDLSPDHDWYEATGLTVDGSTNVSSWASQSSAADLTQATPADRPDGVNDFPEADGVSDYLEGTVDMGAVPTALTFAWIGRADVRANGVRWWRWHNTYVRDTGSTLRFYAPNGSTLLTVSDSSTAERLWIMTWENESSGGAGDGTLRVYRDGALVGELTTVGGITPASSSALRLFNQSGNANFLDGAYRHFLVVQRALTLSERTDYAAWAAAEIS